MKDRDDVRAQVTLLVNHLNESEITPDYTPNRSALQDRDDDRNLIQYCLNSLKNHMFPFTDSNLVLATFHGLVEKFTIRNEPEIAVALKDRVNAFLSLSNSYYKYDMIRLLFSLSNSPNASTFAAISHELIGQIKAPEPEPDYFVFDNIDDEFVPSYSSSSSDESDPDDERELKALDFVEYQKAVADKMKACLAATSQISECVKPKEFLFAECIGILEPEKPIENIHSCIEVGEANPFAILSHRIALALSGVPSDLFARHGDKFSVTGFIPDFNIPPAPFSSLLTRFCEIANQSIILDNFCTKYAADYRHQCLQAAGVYVQRLQQESRLELITFLQSHSNFNIFKLPQIVASYLRRGSYLIPIIMPFATDHQRSVSESCALFLTETYQSIEIGLFEHDRERVRPQAELFAAAIIPYLQCLQTLLEQGYLPGSGYEQFMIECVTDASNSKSFELRGEASVPQFLQTIAQPVLHCVKTLHQLRLSKVLDNSQRNLHLAELFSEKFRRALEEPIFCPLTITIEESILTPVLNMVASVNLAIVNDFFSKNNLRDRIQQIHDIYFMLKGHLFVDFVLELSLQRSRSSSDSARLSRLLHDHLYEYELDECMRFTLTFKPGAFPELHFKFPFPLSPLLFGESNISRYNAIFSLLLEVACAKTILESMMKSFIGTQGKRFLHIKWQISHFISTFHNYIRSQISQSCNDEFIADLESSSSLEELICKHEKFLDGLHRDLLLKESTRVVLAHIRNILSLPGKMKALCTNSEISDEMSNTSLAKIASDFSSSNRFIMALLNQISLKSEARTEFAYVLMHLNFNSFYDHV